MTEMVRVHGLLEELSPLRRSPKVRAVPALKHDYDHRLQRNA